MEDMRVRAWMETVLPTILVFIVAALFLRAFIRDHIVFLVRERRGA